MCVMRIQESLQLTDPVLLWWRGKALLHQLKITHVSLLLAYDHFITAGGNAPISRGGQRASHEMSCGCYLSLCPISLSDS